MADAFYNIIEQGIIDAYAGIPEATKNFADAAIHIIKQRTSRGEFLNGSTRPYNDEYANRVKGGRKAPVTLVQTGQMFKALQVQEGGTGIGFAPSGKGSKFRNDLGQWAAASPSWEETITVLPTPRREPRRRKGQRTNQQVARFHDSGVGRTTFPRRQWLGLTDAESNDLYNKVFLTEVRETGIPPASSQMTVHLEYGG